MTATQDRINDNEQPKYLYQLAWHYGYSVDTMRSLLFPMREELKALLPEKMRKQRRYLFTPAQVAYIIKEFGPFVRTEGLPKYNTFKNKH